MSVSGLPTLVTLQLGKLGDDEAVVGGVVRVVAEREQLPAPRECLRGEDVVNPRGEPARGARLRPPRRHPVVLEHKL